METSLLSLDALFARDRTPYGHLLPQLNLSGSLRAYVRNPLAPRIFVNNIGDIYRLDGGIIQLTFVQKFQDPNLNAVEQGSLIWRSVKSLAQPHVHCF